MGNVLTKRLRIWFELPESCSDERVLQITENTLGRSLVELRLAREKFSKEIWKLIDEDITYWARKLKRLFK